MSSSTTPQPEVTIIVTPRERFSYTRESLESIYEHTEYPFQLIYIDGNSPAPIRDYLAAKAVEKQFQLIRTNYYLSPNHAKNLGLPHVNTKYLVFLDNDVVVTPGWLTSLINCAEETEATIVNPIVCQYLPLHTEVHFAGGEAAVKVETKGDTTRKRLIEKIYKQGKQLKDVRPQLQRQKTGLAEFHCMLVRTDIFEKIGLLDEALLNTKDHLDLCLTVKEAGGSIYLEPSSLVTFPERLPLEWMDVHYYMLRWNDAWQETSLKHLQKKWNLTEDEYFQKRYKGMGWRREMTIITPFIQKLRLGKYSTRLVRKVLCRIDKILNHYIYIHYTKNMQHQQNNILT